MPAGPVPSVGRMGHRDDTRHDRPGAAGPQSDGTAYDRRWARDLADAVRCAAVLLGLLLLIDGGAGSLTPGRGALWCALAVLLFLVLCPARVRAGEGWLASRRLLRTRRVRTDRLVSVRCLDGVSPRLLLRDADGDRVVVDPRVLVASPELWDRLAQGARRSTTDGTLLCGATALRQVAERVERETGPSVSRTSERT